MHAYLLVPREHAAKHLRARQFVRLAWAVAAITLILAAAAAWWWQYTSVTTRVAGGSGAHGGAANGPVASTPNANGPNDEMGAAEGNAQIAIGVMMR